MAYKLQYTSTLQISFFYEFLYSVKLPELKNQPKYLIYRFLHVYQNSRQAAKRY